MHPETLEQMHPHSSAGGEEEGHAGRTRKIKKKESFDEFVQLLSEKVVKW